MILALLSMSILSKYALRLSPLCLLNIGEPWSLIRQSPSLGEISSTWFLVWSPAPHLFAAVFSTCCLFEPRSCWESLLDECFFFPGGLLARVAVCWLLFRSRLRVLGMGWSSGESGGRLSILWKYITSCYLATRTRFYDKNANREWRWYTSSMIFYSHTADKQVEQNIPRINPSWPFVERIAGFDSFMFTDSSHLDCVVFRLTRGQG